MQSLNEDLQAVGRLVAAGILTPHDIAALIVYHGNAIEYQDAQKRLFDHGFRWCPRCSTALPTSEFGKRSRMTLGLDSACKRCDRRKNKPPRQMAKLNNATRLARFFKRNPEKAYSGARGSYAKTRPAVIAGTYLNDPLDPNLSRKGRL